MYLKTLYQDTVS